MRCRQRRHLTRFLSMVFLNCSFLRFCFTPGLPFPKFPLTFFTLIECNDVRQDATGNVLDLMLRNTGIVDELLPASQVVKFTSDFSVFVHRFLTDGSVIGWHGSFPRGNEKCRHLSSNRFLCVCKYFCFNIYRYYSKIGRSCQGKNSGLHTLRV